jgi:hypothetical protein
VLARPTVIENRRQLCHLFGKLMDDSCSVSAIAAIGAFVGALEIGLRRRSGLRKFVAGLQSCDDQMQQSKSKLRVLEVQLLESIIVDNRRLDVRFAADRFHPPAVWGEQADFTEQGSLSESLIDSHDLDLA